MQKQKRDAAAESALWCSITLKQVRYTSHWESCYSLTSWPHSKPWNSHDVLCLSGRRDPAFWDYFALGQMLRSSVHWQRVLVSFQCLLVSVWVCLVLCVGLVSLVLSFCLSCLCWVHVHCPSPSCVSSCCLQSQTCHGAWISLCFSVSCFTLTESHPVCRQLSSFQLCVSTLPNYPCLLILAGSQLRVCSLGGSSLLRGPRPRCVWNETVSPPSRCSSCLVTMMLLETCRTALFEGSEGENVFVHVCFCMSSVWSADYLRLRNCKRDCWASFLCWAVI